MKGTSLAQALKCALKLKAGKSCTVAEMAGAIDTLAWAYKNRKPAVKSVKKNPPVSALGPGVAVSYYGYKYAKKRSTRRTRRSRR